MTSTSVGEQLKQARTALQLSVKDVSQTTKIQGWVLEALETDQLHTTMSSVYVRGFIATYAKLVRLDPQPLLAQLYPPAPVMEIAQGSDGKRSGLGAEGWGQLLHPEPGAQSPERSAGFTPIELPWAALRRLVIGAVGVAAMWALVIVNPMKHLNPHLWVKLQLPHREASLAVPKEPVRVPAASSAVAIEPTQALELTIQARRDTWVSVRADGRLLTQQHLQGGSKESWKARRRLELVVAKPAQVEATLNGRSISPFVMAHQGRLVITHQQIKSLTEPVPRVSTAQAPSAQ